jgi:hypothetical protein
MPARKLRKRFIFFDKRVENTFRLPVEGGGPSYGRRRGHGAASAPAAKMKGSFPIRWMCANLNKPEVFWPVGD